MDQTAAKGRDGPIMRYLRDLHRSLKDEKSGTVADYIPELGLANPDDFGIVVATVDGAVYAVGDTEQPFTIQSISKAFVYGKVLADYGRAHVLTKVGVEPSGDAFNAIVFDDAANRPFNPMVNSGAIATAALIRGDTVADRIGLVRDLFDRLAGRKLGLNDGVFQSEKATGHRNRAIAWMMLNAGMITGQPDEVLDVYFSQCSIEVTCRDLAMMAATLASGGVQPLTGERVLPGAAVRDVISVMNSCGMYNYAGQWSFEVGLPAKSGVGGGIIAVAPGQLGIAVYSPPLDRLGNSVRGIAAFKSISRDFSLHVFGAHAHSSTIVRREIGGDVVRSKRLRSQDERRILDASGQRIRLVELQGALYFGTAERLIRRLESIEGDGNAVVIDFRRVHLLDEAAAELLVRASEAGGGPEMIFAGVHTNPALADLAARLSQKRQDALFQDADSALQWCEDRLIGQAAKGMATHFSLSGLAVFTGLSKDEIRLLEGIVKAQVFEKGDVIIREGDAARLFYVIASGSVGVRLRPRDGAGSGKRIATFGPGLSFGEMALFDGGARSADIIAEEHVVCYGFSVESLYALGKEHPHLLVTVLANMTREMAERLRRANEEIRALEV